MEQLATRRATAQLLWAGCRPTVDVAAVRAAIDAGADVEQGAIAALGGRTGPLLWRALGAAGARDLAGSVGAHLEQEADLRRVQAALLLPQALRAVLDPLTAAGLEPLLFKGPALAARYPEPGLRPMDDIDVLLPPGQHAAGLRALQAAGWVDVPDRDGHHYDNFLVHPRVPGIPVELHWELESWRNRAHHLRGDAVWRRRVPMECFGIPAFGLPPEDELIALAVHAGKPFHHFERLIWSVDVAVVIAAAPDLDWDRVAAAAKRAACQTVLAVILGHARRLGADVPTALLDVPWGTVRASALAPVLEEAWPLHTPDDGAVAHRLRYALPDSARRRTSLLLAEVIEVPAARVPAHAVRVAAMATRRWWSDRSA